MKGWHIVLIIVLLGVIAIFGFCYKNMNNETNEVNNVENEIVAQEETEEEEEVEENVVENVVEKVVEEVIINEGGTTEVVENVVENTQEVVPEEEVIINTEDLVGKIQIEKLNIDYNVLGTVTTENLQKGPCVMYGPGINKEGNTTIAFPMYDSNYEKAFAEWEILEVGDIVTITDNEMNTINYEISEVFKTDYHDASYLIRDAGGIKQIVLAANLLNIGEKLVFIAQEKTK